MEQEGGGHSVSSQHKQNWGGYLKTKEGLSAQNSSCTQQSYYSPRAPQLTLRGLPYLLPSQKLHPASSQSGGLWGTHILGFCCPCSGQWLKSGAAQQQLMKTRWVFQLSPVTSGLGGAGGRRGGFQLSKGFLIGSALLCREA